MKAQFCQMNAPDITTSLNLIDFWNVHCLSEKMIIISVGSVNA